MTLQIAYTATGVTNFVDTSIDAVSEAQTPIPNPDDIAAWAQEVTLAVEPAPRTKRMAERASVTIDELCGIQAQTGLSWPALELLIAALNVTWHDRGG